MRYFLLFLLFLPVCLQAETYSGSWRFAGFSFTGTKPAGTSAWVLKGYSSSGTEPLFSGSLLSSDNTLTAYTVSGKTSTNSVTAEWAYVAVGYTQTGVGFVPKMWCQCRPNDGRPAYDPPRNGPFDESGNREDSAGNPVNDQGEGIPEPEPDGMYRYDIVYNNGNKFPVHINYTVQEGADGGGEILMIGNSASIQPGTGWSKTFRFAYPFGVSWLVAREDNDEQVGDPTDGLAEPTEEEQPPEGEPGGPGGPLAPGGDTTTPGTIQVPKPDPITPVARPDAPIAGEGNAEARHNEALQAIGRVADAVNDAANQAAGDADLTNDYLSKIKDGIEDLAEGGNDSGEVPGGTPEGALPGTSVLENLGLDQNILELRQGMAAIVTATGNLRAAAGMSQMQGSSPLAWNMPAGVFGTINLDVSNFMGTWVDLFRKVCLGILTLSFIPVYLRDLTKLFA